MLLYPARRFKINCASLTSKWSHRRNGSEGHTPYCQEGELEWSVSIKHVKREDGFARMRHPCVAGKAWRKCFLASLVGASRFDPL